ncbi:MAG: flavodoxin [Lachnoclostridium sp.]|nr:flavodoxin [Lachnospira sp.]MCM1249332.1 flavodoxin [Lachnoclostridium sp.]MCM1536442.1 flavodoxin [Clostridium sp.]
MKKVTAILISMLVMLCLAACGNSENGAGQPSRGDNPVNTAADNDTLPESSSAENKGSTDSANLSANQPESTEASEVQPESGKNTESQQAGEENADMQGTKILVAYFSATNTTKGVAEHIANGLNADIYEIVPQEPYTAADLNYNDNNSRTTIEMNDPSARPVISGSVENMEQYDIVFIGYPIWWGEAPRILDTFVESYDFSGKTVVPFCTSGGSGVGSSATNLEKLTNGADWLSGKRLNGSDSQDTVMEWVNGLGLDFGE